MPGEAGGDTAAVDEGDAPGDVGDDGAADASGDTDAGGDTDADAGTDAVDDRGAPDDAARGVSLRGGIGWASPTTGTRFQVTPDRGPVGAHCFGRYCVSGGIVP